MNEQLSLFSEKGSEYFRTGAESLLEALNLDRKPKEKYQIEYYYQHKNFFVLIACNIEKKPICNIVDENGKIPNGFCVNWRNHNLVTEKQKKINNMQLLEINKMLKEGVFQKDIALKYNVSQRVISKIKLGIY